MAVTIFKISDNETINKSRIAMANSFESNITYNVGHMSKGRSLLYQILFDSFFLIFPFYIV